MTKQIETKLEIVFDGTMDIDILDDKVQTILTSFDALTLAMIKSCKLTRVLSEVEVNA